MTTATATLSNRTLAGTRPSLEELVDRLMAALFMEAPETEAPTATPTPEQSATRSIPEARRLRQAGDFDGGLAVLAGVDVAKATPREARWAFSEWSDLVRPRLKGRDALLYTQGAGRAAVLVPGNGGLLEVAAVLGMRWPPGKLVSERSLRGLRPLERVCLRPKPGNGVSRP